MGRGWDTQESRLEGVLSDTSATSSSPWSTLPSPPLHMRLLVRFVWVLVPQRGCFGAVRTSSRAGNSLRAIKVSRKLKPSMRRLSYSQRLRFQAQLDTCSYHCNEGPHCTSVAGSGDQWAQVASASSHARLDKSTLCSIALGS